MTEERRRAPRHVACFVTFIERSEDKRAAAMIMDLSEAGIRLMVRNPDWEVGDDLHLDLHLSLELDMAHARHAIGRVVRMVELTDDRKGLWTHEVAVDLADRLTLSAAEREIIEKRKPQP